MNIYISHSREFDFENELYKPIRESSLNNFHTFFLPHENQRDLNNLEILRNSKLVIAEVSFPSTGQGIEIGVANMLNIPVVCVYKEGSKISGSLKYATDKFITYKNSRDFIAKISEFLLKFRDSR